MVLNTFLFFLFSDDGDPNHKPLEYYTFQNAKGTSEECTLFTYRLSRFLFRYVGTKGYKYTSRFSRILNLLIYKDIPNTPLKLNNVSERHLYLFDKNHDIGIRIQKKSDIVLTWIVKFWFSGINISEYLFTVLKYPQEFITKDEIEEAIFNAEKKLNIHGKLEAEWEKLTQYLP